MSRMGMPATVLVEPDVCLPSPHRHASGHRLPGQWTIPFITWKKLVPRLAAAIRHTVEVHHRSCRKSEWRSIRETFAESS